MGHAEIYTQHARDNNGDTIYTDFDGIMKIIEQTALIETFIWLGLPFSWFIFFFEQVKRQILRWKFRFTFYYATERFAQAILPSIFLQIRSGFWIPCFNHIAFDNN